MFGNWSNANAWSTGPFFPNNGNQPGVTYAVVIPASNFQLTLDTSVTIDKLDHQHNGLIINSGRTLAMLQRLDLSSTAFITNNGGTLSAPLAVMAAGSLFTSNGGTVTFGQVDLGGTFTMNTSAYSGGVFNITGQGRVNGSGRFVGTTFNIAPGGFARAIAMSTSPANSGLYGVTINGNLDLPRTRIFNGLTLNGVMSGSDTSDIVAFEGAQTIGGNGTFSLHGASIGSVPQFTVFNDTGTTTFAPTTTITAGFGTITGSGVSASMLGQGLIRAESGGRLTLSGLNLTNQGTIDVENGATLFLTGGSLVNTGTINLGVGARLTIDQDRGVFTGTTNFANGIINLRRTLDLAGGSMDIGATGGTWNLGGETVSGTAVGAFSNGTLTTSGGAVLTSRNSSSMNGVLFNGNLAVAQGTFTASNSTLAGSISVPTGTTLRTNGGSVTANVSLGGGTLEMLGNFSAGGAVEMSAGSLLLDGTFTLGSGFSMNRTGGTVELRGVLDNVGKTLELNQNTGSWVGSQLEISGGTVRTIGSQSFIGLRRLGDVQIDGTLALSSGSTEIIDGLTGGTVQLGGQGVGLWFLGDVTFENTTIRAVTATGANSIGSASDAKIITIDPGSSIRGGDLAISFATGGSYPGPNTLINQGLISADLAGQEISIQGATFQNTGLIEARSGGTLRFVDLHEATGNMLVTGAGSRIIVDGDSNTAFPSFTLNGTTTVSDAGVLRLQGRDHWSNTGTISLSTGGRLETVSLVTRAELGLLVSPDSTGVLAVMDGLDNTGGQLDLDAMGMDLELSGRIFGGTIQSVNQPVAVMPGFGMELNSLTLNGDLTLSGSSLTARGSVLNGETSVNATSTLTLADNWTNSGSITVAGTANLGGTFSAASFAGISRDPAGQVHLVGELDLSGQSFSFSSTGVLTSIGSGGALTVDAVDISQGFSLPMTGTATVRTSSVTGSGSVTGGRFSPKASGSLTVDAGLTLTGTGLGRTPTLDPGLITSHATMIGGSVSSGQFVNEGLLDAPAGHTLNLGYSSGTAAETQWTNNGTVRVSGGTLNLGGSFTTATLESVDYLSGTLALSGEIDNSGDTMTFGPGGWTNLTVQTVNGTAGRIRGGVVNIDPGASVPNDLRFDSLTINGDVTGDHHYRGGITLNGTHAGGNAFFRHDTTLEAGLFNNVGMFLQGKDLTLEIEPGVTLLSTSGRSIIGDVDPNNPGIVGLVNRGHVLAQGTGSFWNIDVRESAENQGILEATLGGRLIITSSVSNPFLNTGTISVTGGSILELQGEHNLTSLGNVSLVNSTFRRITGNMELDQGTFALTPGNTYELAGVFQNGTIQQQGGTLSTLGGIFVNTHFSGDFLFDDGATFMNASADGTLTIPQSRQLIIPFTQSFDSGDIVLAGGSNFVTQAAEIQLTRSGSTPNQLTIGADATIIGRNARIGRNNGGFSPNDPLTLVNNGTISTDQAGKRLDLVLPMVVNNGVLEARNGATLRIGIAGTETLRFVNNGTILARDASRIELVGLMNGSVLSGIDALNSTIAIGTAALDNAGNTITLQAGLGNTYNIGNTIIRGGTLNIQPGASVNISTTGSLGVLFDRVAVNGPLTARDLKVAGGFTGQMTLNLGGVLAMEGGNQSIGPGNTIVLGDAGTTGTLQGPLDATLTIDPGAIVRGGPGLIITGPDSFNGTRTVVNQGLISADVNGQAITIRSYRFQNLGTVQAINGGTIIYVPPLDDPVASTNDGYMRIDGSSQVVASDLFELTTSSVLEFVLNPRGLATGNAQLIAPHLTLGGALIVSLDPSFQPAGGNVFNLMDMWDAQGEFDSIRLAALQGGLSWDTSDLYAGGSLRVVPAPGVAPIAILSLALAARRRNRQ